VAIQKEGERGSSEVMKIKFTDNRPYGPPSRMKSRHQGHKSPFVPAPEWELVVLVLEPFLRLGESSPSSKGDPLGRGAPVGEVLSNAVSLEKG